MHRILRVPPRESLCTTDDGDAIKNVHGTVVVWWTERIKQNFDAQSIPYVDVVFRYLDRYDEPAGFHVAQIGISRLGSFRLGTIWQNGRCVAETDLGDDHEFTVDFTEGTYSYLSITGSSHDYPFFKKDYRLRSQSTSDVITELLNFPLSTEKNLLIPCIEFLYRCYGSTSDMGRILATYPWDEVIDRLHARVQKDVNTWLVWPAPDVPNDDALFLASALYDPYTENAAKLIYAQLDNARGQKLHETSLRVKPWFQGPAKLRVRGRWINDGNTFLCYEVTGMSQPQHHPYEIRRVKYSKSDLQPDEPPIDLYKRKIELPKQEDPFAITDFQEPDVGASKWSKSDPGFHILGAKCTYTTSFEQRSFSKRHVIPDTPNGGKVRSTGDPTGHNKNVDKFKAVANRVMGDGGVLASVWKELERLCETRSGFVSLSWKSEKKGFIQSSDFKLLPLPPFTEHDSSEDAPRRWLTYSANANRTRGILVIRAKIDKRTFYLFELQRKKVLKKKAYEEEQISGLLLEVNNETEAEIEISRICDEIRSVSGNFRKLKTPISHSHRIFRHHTSVRSTLHYAFEYMGIMLYKNAP